MAPRLRRCAVERIVNRLGTDMALKWISRVSAQSGGEEMISSQLGLILPHAAT